MLSRYTLLACLFTLTLSAGVAVFYLQDDPYFSRRLHLTARKETFGIGHQKAKPVGLVDEVQSNISYLTNRLTTNKELVFYGALALAGVSIVIFTIGITPRRSKDPKDSMLEVLQEEKKRAENLARIKTDFLSHISHELRTPLAVIIGYVECITDGLYGQVGSKHQEILEIVAKQSTHLKEMIDQILIYSRLDSNRQALHIQEFMLSDVVAELKDTFGFLCRQKELDLCWELPLESTVLQTDPDTLKEILSNLLQNAVKYTDRGTITVRITNIPETQSITLEVADTGIGIPETHLATIFEPFIQVHRTSTEKSRGGIGLGLSIVKKHVEQIKGRISVESGLGKGTAFRVTLPHRYEEQPREKQLLNLFKIPYRRVPKGASNVAAKAPDNDVKGARQAVG